MRRSMWLGPVEGFLAKARGRADAEASPHAPPLRSVRPKSRKLATLLQLQ
jgi:hypothetical protein